jgi:DNA topoisomerase-1
MTQTLEAHMQQIKESKRTREDAVRESREMLHHAFDQLEANEQVIGDDIRNRTAEEMNLGKCPVCGGTLAIKHLRGNTQFIGCSRYPDCSFNIGLPMAQWGFAVRTDEVCEKHQLNFVRLVRKGARPWDIGCPLCHHVNSNSESLAEIPSLDEALAKKIRAQHIYTVAELAHSTPELLAKKLDLPLDKTEHLIREAATVLAMLRRRSECRKFLRENLIPRKGRSYSKIMSSLKESGISELGGLAKTDIASLKKAGIGDGEAETILTEAKKVYHGQVLKEIGIPAVSLKKYLSAGIMEPESFCTHTPAALGELTGMSPATVQKHVEIVCRYLNKPLPKKLSKIQIEKGKKELLAVKGLSAAILEKLFRADIVNGDALLKAEAAGIATATGIPEQKIRDFQALLRKKRDTAVIQI